jgi:YbbR domain-containing protein
MTLRDLILNNFVWKLISLILAMLVWWHVNNLVETEKEQAQTPAASPETTGTFSLPVRVLGPARNPVGFAVVPGEVTVTLRGKADALEQVNATNVVVYVDATFARGAKSATLTVMVRPPAGISVQGVKPPEVYVERM